ncbi:MAG: helix-turn-helix domain-containing protein [Alphaproteobacteria bacterium]|nr:helix-turn-helix domain-containing protein [Alphaproteobacteria bacterium]
MSIIEDDSSAHLAARIARERESRDWSLADLAARSGVSKAMLSKIERRQASPTALIIGRIAAAFGLTLATLLTEPEAGEPRLLTKARQPVWGDPATGYVRRQVYLSAGMPVELVEIELPPAAAVSFPASTYVLTRHVVWVLEGRLVIVEGDSRSELAAGDRLAFGPPSDTTFRNEARTPCRYLVTVLRTN